MKRRQQSRRLIDDFRRGPITQVPWGWYNKVAHTLNTLKVVDANDTGIGELVQTIDGRQTRLRLDVSASVACSWRLVSKDSSTGKAVIGVGTVIFGTKLVYVVETTVTIGGGTATAPAYVVLDYTMGASTAIIQPNTTNAYPSPSAGRLLLALHSLYISDAGVITQVRQHQFGDILASTFMAGT